MDKRANDSLLIVVLCVGLVTACALFMGLSAIAKTIDAKSFGSASTAAMSSSVVSLSNDRFAVVSSDGSSIDVYDIDNYGHIARLDSVDTTHEKLQPNVRRANSQPMPPLTPQPTVPPELTPHIIVN